MTGMWKTQEFADALYYFNIAPRKSEGNTPAKWPCCRCADSCYPHYGFAAKERIFQNLEKELA